MMRHDWHRHIILDRLPGPGRLEELRRQGVRRLINLCGVALVEISGTEALAPFEDSIYVFADVFSQGAPVSGTEDWAAVDAGLYLRYARQPREREQLLGAITAVHAALREPEPVFVFCEQGRSRSPLVVTAALLCAEKASLAEAVRLVRTLQPRTLLTDIGLSALSWSRESLESPAGETVRAL